MAAEANEGAGERSAEVEAFVREYIRLWNARDLEAIWSRVYRLEPGVRPHSKAELEASVAQLASEGFDHTELHSVEGRQRSPTEAEAVIRFTRVKADGAPMPPGNRGAKYELRRFDDGWRIVRLMAVED